MARLRKSKLTLAFIWCISVVKFDNIKRKRLRFALNNRNVSIKLVDGIMTVIFQLMQNMSDSVAAYRSR